MRRTRTAHRWLLLTAVGAATTLALTACGGAPAETPSTAPTLSDEPVTLSFTWWGNDVRHEITEQLIAAFEAEHENITIEPQYTDWAGYWDKLATTVAAGDAPDIIQMDEKQLSTYAANGVLLDLSELGTALPTEDFPAPVLGTGALDGVQYGVPVGINSYTYMANIDLLDSLGIDVPDDETWSWDDFTELAEEITAASGGAVVGSQSWGFEDGGLNNWLRQHGESLYADDGSPEVTASEKTLAAWWQLLLDVTEAGGTPDPSATIERESAGLAESFTAKNQSAFGPWWSNQVAALRSASGQNLEPLMVPDARRGRDRGGVLQAVDVLVGFGQDRAPGRGRPVPRLARQQRRGGRPAARRARRAGEREDPRVHHAEARRGQPGGRRLPRADQPPRRRRSAGNAPGRWRDRDDHRPAHPAGALRREDAEGGRGELHRRAAAGARRRRLDRRAG